MLRNLILPAALLGALVFQPGCVTLNKYNALKERVEVLEKDKAEMSERMARDEARVENLHERMKKAQEDLRRSGADRGATLDDLRVELAKSYGKAEEFAFRLDAAEKRLTAVLAVLDEKLGASIAVATETLPEDKGELYALGETRLTQGAPDKARSIFRIYAEKHPDDEKADDALLMIGETYYQEGKYDLAIQELQSLHDKHPKSELLPKALWRIADSLAAKKECKKAQAVLKYLKDTQKKSEEAAKVPARLKELGELCK